MYRIGQNTLKRRHRHWLMVVLTVLVLGAVAIWLKQALHTTTTISAAPPAVTHTVVDNKQPTKAFDEPLFSLALPTDWQLKSHETQPAGTSIYTWENGAANPGTHVISLYVDSTPASLGVNRAVLVQANGSGLSVIGDVSDNCAGFTNPNSSVPSVSTPAKWQNQPFLCDLGNYERDVVGTVSADGINKVLLSGPTSGQHSLFFTFTDSDIEPDFTVFTDALQSFRLK